MKISYIGNICQGSVGFADFVEYPHRTVVLVLGVAEQEKLDISIPIFGRVVARIIAFPGEYTHIMPEEPECFSIR
jgi:hypothetical protein